MKNLLLLGRINKEVGLLTKSGLRRRVVNKKVGINKKKAMTFTGYRSKSSIGISLP